MGKFFIGFIFTMLGCLWFFMYLNVFVLHGWQEQWYAFPLLISELMGSVTLAFLVGTLLENIDWRWTRRE